MKENEKSVPWLIAYAFDAFVGMMFGLAVLGWGFYRYLFGGSIDDRTFKLVAIIALGILVLHVSRFRLRMIIARLDELGPP